MSYKKWICLFVIVMGIMIPKLTHAGEDRGETPTSERIYINPTHIGFSENAIYVNLEGNWVAVEALRADHNGIYCEAEQVGILDLTWLCTECGYVNSIFSNYCEKDGCPGRKKDAYDKEKKEGEERREKKKIRKNIKSRLLCF